jgi:LEA14-like dessication related protein
MKTPIIKLLILFFTISLTSCAQLAKHADTIKPTAKVTGVRLANINFEQADLVFELAVENKNPVSLKLAGLDYDLKIESQSLVSGTTAQAIKIKANSTSSIQLPITLKFDDLKKLPGELWNKDKITYQLLSKFNVNLPIIGNYAIPIEKKGELPIPKVPDISIRDVNVKNISFTTAELVARIEVSNPNDFDIGVSNLNYQLNINQKNWGQGKVSNNINIPKKGKGIVEVPLKLNIFSVGKSAYDLVVNKKQVEYQLKGSATINTVLELLKNYDMPLDISGTTSLR